MARERRDEQIIEVEKETTYGTEKTGGPLVLVPTAADFSSVHEAMVANAQYTVDGGSRSPAVGTFVDAAPSLSCYPQGLGEALADTVSPTPTAFSHLIGSVFQSAGDLIKTSKAKSATVPTTTESIEDADNVHLVTAYGSTTAVGIALLEYAAGNRAELVPYTYTVGTDKLTFLMETPQAQAVGDRIRGGIVHQWAQSWTSAAPPNSVTVRSLGNDTTQNRKIYGGVGGMQIAAVAPNELPQAAFSFRCSGGGYSFADTRPTPSAIIPRVFAGSSLHLGLFGDTTRTDVCGRVDINFSGPSLVAECPNSASGIQGYHRGKEQIEVRLTLPHDVLPGNVGSGMAGGDWVTQWTTYPEEYLHLLVGYGQRTSGACLAFYFPKLIIAGVEEGEVNELDTRTLLLRPAADSAYAHAVSYQG